MARMLKAHYVVERRSTYQGEVLDEIVIAQFHFRKDAEAFLKASLHPYFEHRIVCVSNRCHSKPKESEWQRHPDLKAWEARFNRSRKPKLIAA